MAESNKDDALKAITEIADEISERLKADLYLYAGSINRPYDEKFGNLLRRNKQNDNLWLLLATFGGNADCAYRIARYAQRYYSQGKLTLFIPTYCKSAGTIIAVGFEELVISDEGELGPVDIQIPRPDELFEYLSGLAPVQALDALGQQAFQLFESTFLALRKRSRLQLTTRTAALIASKIACGLFGKIYAQMDPVRLGEYGRATNIAIDYGMRLLRHRNMLSDTTLSYLSSLVNDYASHEFVIDREEATDGFWDVRGPEDDEIKLAQAVKSIMSAAMTASLQEDRAKPRILRLSSVPPKETGDESNGKPENCKADEAPSEGTDSGADDAKNGPPAAENPSLQGGDGAA